MTPEQQQHIVMARIAAATVHLAAYEAREDLGRFIPLVVRDDHGDPLILAEMHRQWLLHVGYCWQHGLRAIVMGHFGSGKSSTLSVPIICYALGRDPNMRIKVITNDDASARKRVGACKSILESLGYRHVFRNARRGRKWTEHELYLERQGHAIDPSLEARGVMSTGIGSRADLIVFDDVCDQRNSTDPLQRKKVLSVVESTWLSRLEPDGRVLMVATPWHQDDTTHHLIRRKGWCTLVQRVSEDCRSIEQTVTGATAPGYPVAKTTSSPNGIIGT